MVDGRFRGLCTIGALAAGLMLITATGSARAQSAFKMPTNAKAKKHLDTGNRYYKLQKFREAITEYKAGALLEDVPIFLYNLGQTYRQLGEYANAIWYYKRYLYQGKPSAKRKSWVNEVIKDMEKELQRSARTKPPTGPGPGGNVPTSIVTPNPGPRDDINPWYSDKLGWVLTGVGVVGVGFGAGFFFNASDLEDRANASQDQDEREALRQTANSRRTIATITTLAGAALVVTGIVRLVLNPQPKNNKPASGVSLAVGTNWLGVVGRF